MAGVEQNRAIEPVVAVLAAPRVSTLTQGRDEFDVGRLRGSSRQGTPVGIRLLVDSTTPPMACEPNRNVAGPRMTSIWLVVRGSTGMKWSSPKSDAPLAPTPFSWMPTRFTSSPRTIGRLDAPGAKLDPVIPGRENRTSPSVPPGERWISSRVTTVTVANWSATIGSHPGGGSVEAGGGTVGGAWGGAGVATRRALTERRRGRGRGRAIGVGAVTTTSGRTVCALAVPSRASSPAPATPPSSIQRPNVTPMNDSNRQNVIL